MGGKDVLFLPRHHQSLSHHGVLTWRCDGGGADLGV